MLKSQWSVISTLCVLLILGSVLLVSCDAVPTSPAPTRPSSGDQGTGSQSPTEVGPQPGPADVLISAKSRDLSPEVPADVLRALSEGNTAFALDLYQVLRAEDGNLFYSPYSISLALAMTYAGARANTEAQMADVLHFNLPQEQLHPAFNALDQALISRAELPTGEGEQGFQLNIANAIWGQEGYPFLPVFLDQLATHYGAGLRLADFMTDSEGSRQVINQWVSDQTEGRIKDLIPEGAITDLTRLVLSNAIYFNAGWMLPFDEALTKESPFTLLNGEQIDVSMMSLSEPELMNYYRGDGYQAVELPYRGGELGMVVLLPDTGGFEAFESALTGETLQEIVDNLAPITLKLSLPKFEYDASLSLVDTLAAMGMPDPLTAGVADFSGMDGSQLLYISDVFHKAFVAVDEQGTEAAAATAVIVSVEMVVEAELEMTVDRPFIFLIRDLETGTILFVGRVINPVS